MGFRHHEINRMGSYESNLYEVATEKLTWSFQSETIDPQNIRDVVDSLGKVVMAALRKDGLLK